MTATQAIETLRCDGCGDELSTLEALQWSVCLPCTRARHRAAVHGKCTCGRKRRERIVSTSVRAWVACDRCLGVVRALPDSMRRKQRGSLDIGDCWNLVALALILLGLLAR